MIGSFGTDRSFRGDDDPFDKLTTEPVKPAGLS